MSVRGFGVLSQDLEDFFTKLGEILRDNFVGVFPLDKKQEFPEVQLEKNLKSKKISRYPFIVTNANLQKKPGTRWWSFLNIDGKDTLFFSIALVVLDCSTL